MKTREVSSHLFPSCFEQALKGFIIAGHMNPFISHQHMPSPPMDLRELQAYCQANITSESY